jgi:hypothetical protein
MHDSIRYLLVLASWAPTFDRSAGDESLGLRSHDARPPHCAFFPAAGEANQPSMGRLLHSVRNDEEGVARQECGQRRNNLRMSPAEFSGGST